MHISAALLGNISHLAHVLRNKSCPAHSSSKASAVQKLHNRSLMRRGMPPTCARFCHACLHVPCASSPLLLLVLQDVLNSQCAPCARSRLSASPSPDTYDMRDTLACVLRVPSTSASFFKLGPPAYVRHRLSVSLRLSLSVSLRLSLSVSLRLSLSVSLSLSLSL